MSPKLLELPRDVSSAFQPLQCILDVRALLDDAPSDLELVRLQAQALLAGALNQGSVLHLVALHAVNRALFAHQPGRRRFQTLLARNASPQLAQQLFFYKNFDPATGIAFYAEGQLPAIRQKYLDGLLKDVQ